MSRILRALRGHIHHLAQPLPDNVTANSRALLRDQALTYLNGAQRWLDRVYPLLELFAKAHTYDPGETDLDDEQPVSMHGITLKEVRLARTLLYDIDTRGPCMTIIDHGELNNGWAHYFRMQKPSGDVVGFTIDTRFGLILQVDIHPALTLDELEDALWQMRRTLGK